jgi:hypothetical protein
MPFISNGTTILDNGAFSVGLGSQILLSTATASASASIEFTSGIDSTYDIYKFELINCHASTDNSKLLFNGSTDGGSTYNVTKTTTAFVTDHNESDTSTQLAYNTSFDLAQSTADQRLGASFGIDNDQSMCATMYLFSPSSTTYVKHFIATSQNYTNNDFSQNYFVAGYMNTTSSVNAIKFVMDSGNIDAGTIKMYGIKGS